MNTHQQEYIDRRLSTLSERWETKLINVYEYLNKFKINTVNLLLSGGADSTLVLLALLQIKKKYMSSLKINTLTVDLNGLDTFDEEDVIYVLDQLDTSKFIHKHSMKIDLLYGSVSDSELSEEAKHQAGYAYRYLELFTLCEHNKGISVGTTNLDEFAYIGWFGKHSDMNVDLQFITDLHKFEVFALLDKYKISIKDQPKGNLLNGLTDEEIFGCSYNDVAYYSYCKYNNIDIVFNTELDMLHIKNRHKYLGQTFNPYFIVDKDYFFKYEYKLC